MGDRDDLVGRISAALDHIDKHGSLKSFAGDAARSQALIDAASAQQLIEWNDQSQRYHLSRAARKWLSAYYHGGSRSAR